MSPCQGLVEFKLAAAGNDIFLMVEIVVQDLFERQDARMAVDEGQHDDAERFLELRVFIQFIQDDIGIDIGRSSTTMRIPLRSDSSRRAVMPSISLLRDKSAMDSMTRALLT